MQIPFIDGDKEILFAITLQNDQHKKNNIRREAATDKTYVEILTKDDAIKYLSSLLFKAIQSEVGKSTNYGRFVHR